MEAVAVELLHKTYGKTSAVENLSFTVEPGSLYGLIGPDGAGKTTFMRIAACLLLQDAGTLLIEGLDTRRREKDIKSIIGYMPQRFSLYPDLSVRENLVFFADLFGVGRSEREKRIGQLLEFSRLGPFLNRRAEALSGGMKQKLALSCTLIHTPRVLFLDEPTTGVDPVSRREFWSILADIRRNGTTIVVSTPYMDEAEKCDRVGFMMNGAFVMEGTPDEIPKRFGRDILSVRAPGLVKRSRGFIFPDCVLDVQTFGDRLHLTVADAEKALPTVRSFLMQQGIKDLVIERTDTSMEDVFMDRMRSRAETVGV